MRDRSPCLLLKQRARPLWGVWIEILFQLPISKGFPRALLLEVSLINSILVPLPMDF